MQIDSQAGKPASHFQRIDIDQLTSAYYDIKPDIHNPSQRVRFGTSGHRGSSLNGSFNEFHILAITQAICDYRKKKKITGALFLGIDTHALSKPALETAIEVLSANRVDLFLSQSSPYTPTPVISHAILQANRGKKEQLADGIVITPSHNPPDQGGFKYNSPHGGPAEGSITQWIEERANQLIENGCREIPRMPINDALKTSTTHYIDYLDAYVKDLEHVIDMEVIQGARLKLAVDPLGGAGIDYWDVIRERYQLDLTIVNQRIDPTFAFMTLDWDGKIRMDPSSPYAMQRLIGLQNDYDITFACDTDHDRHGIVTKSSGLLPSNHYLSVAIAYLLEHRKKWNPHIKVGKTLVSSQMIDCVVKQNKRELFEVPVGFKWFVDGLFNGSLGFGGEESAGASFLRQNGSVWTTDKDGIILSLLSAEITARMGKDPGQLYQNLIGVFREPFYERIEAKADLNERELLKNLSSEQIHSKELAGEAITKIQTKAEGNQQPIGGIKVATENGWFAARPSGTENIYKIYAESFISTTHLQQILQEAQTLVNQTLKQHHHGKESREWPSS